VSRRKARPICAGSARREACPTKHRAFVAIRGIDELAGQMLNVAVAWQVYAATHDAMSLAWVGLARLVPNLGMALIAGHMADRFDRRSIVACSLAVQALGAAALGLFSAPVYAVLFAIGAAQAFAFPAMSALQPQLVSAQEFPRAVALSSAVFQICTLAGPAAGGLIYAASGRGMYTLTAALYLAALALTPLLGRHPPGGQDSESAFAGLRYIRDNRLLLSILSLDLFAVLLGGITALLPIYASDILRAGPAGLGCLRCAPGIGAAMVGLLLARRGIGPAAGRWMLAGVAGFGLAIVVFALSTNLWLSLGALMGAGGFDMVSMVIRQTLVQVSTPGAMRGRVSAVQGIFIGVSSELGEFESGATAAMFGTVPAALLGGLGTLAVVALWSRIFPELARTDRLVT